MNEVFDHKNFLEDRQVGIIAMRFRGKAIAWWRREKQMRQYVDKAPVTSWRKMEDKIRKYFLEPLNKTRTNVNLESLDG